jgi:TolB-like protein
MMSRFKFLSSVLACAGLVSSLSVQAQPVVQHDQAIVSNRANQLVPNTYRYEPILLQSSRSPSGIFNSGVIFLGEQLDRSVSSDVRSRATVITTFVNLNNLTETTNFGRLVGEHLMHELQIKNWSVTDVRMTRDLIINTAGEFSLSRDIKRLRESMPADNVLTGTYYVTTYGFLLNIRVLDLASGLVVGSAQTRFIKDAFLSAMIDAPKAPATVRLTN